MEFKPRFTIRANFYDYDYGQGIKYRDDIISWTVQRCPLARTASSSILIINLPLQEAQLLKNLIYTQIYPKVNIELYLIDETKAKNKANAKSAREKVQAIPDNALLHKYYSAKQMVIGIQLLESDEDKNYVRCLLVLANPLFVFLNNTNSFSKEIKTGKTALEILDDFEHYLSSNFGNIFWSHRVVNNVFENTYRYEQLLPRIKSDLLVPNMLLYKYKAYDSFGFYFFDDFCLDKQSQKPIALHYINLGDHNVFEKYDLKTDEDFKNWYGMTIKKQSVVYDILSKITPMFKLYGNKNYTPPQNLIVYNYTMSQIHKQDVGKDYIPKGDGQVNISNFQNKVEVPEIDFDINIEEVDDQFTYKIIYAPDGAKRAVKRFLIASHQISDYLNQVLEYKIKECYPHVFNFGYTYNLVDDPSKGEEFFITPISIVNHFYRTSGPMPILSHELRTQVVQMYIKGDENMSNVTGTTNNNPTSVVDDNIIPVTNASTTLTPTQKEKLVKWVMNNGGRNHLSRAEAERIVEAAYKTKYPDLILATAYRESSFNPKAISKDTKYGRSYGLTQVNWHFWGDKLKEKGIANKPEDLYDPIRSIRAAEVVIDEMHKTNPKYDGTLKGHVAAYYGVYDSTYYNVLSRKLKEIHNIVV